MIDLKNTDILHKRLSEVIGSQWGIGWNYFIGSSREGAAIRITTTQPSVIKMSVEVVGTDVLNALDNALVLLQSSIDRDKVKPAAPKHEIWTPSEMDLYQMDEFFRQNMALYTKQFATQISQSGIVEYSRLTDEQRIMLCGKLKSYLKAINNE